MSAGHVVPALRRHSNRQLIEVRTKDVTDNLVVDIRDRIRELRDDYDLGGRRDDGVVPEIGEF